MTRAPVKRPTALDLVVPCYNEEEALPETHRQLAALMQSMRCSGQIAAHSRIYYIDDGSHDRTWELIGTLSRHDPSVVGIRLSRNFGHQAALMAGLLTADGDAVVSIDADLQDDIAVIPEMVQKYCEGYEVVYGVRRQRVLDTSFKRNTALLYYGVLRRLGADVVQNHADYRLMGRRAIDALREYREVNLFLRGIVPMLGYGVSSVYYDRKNRLAGRSKYNLPKMLHLAVEGITSLSAVPLRLVSAMGVLVFVLSLVMAAWVLYVRLFTTHAVPGWASSVLPTFFLGAIQLLCLGVIGEYVAKAYLEIKRRPRYLIAETTTPSAIADMRATPAHSAAAEARAAHPLNAERLEEATSQAMPDLDRER